MRRTTPNKDLSKEEKATLYDMFDYFCTKIDFGHSSLDNTAIRCMNTLFIELKKQKETFDV